MSGTENLKGFDYQISLALYKTLQHISNYEGDVSFLFESLSEEEEDFNILRKDRNEFYQIKKRNEGYHWTPSDLKDIFSKFLSKKSTFNFFYFVTNGTANGEVKGLKDFLSGKDTLTDAELGKFLPDGYALSDLKLLLNNTQIITRFFSSDDDDDPASLLRSQIQQMLHKPPFELSKLIDQIYPHLWKIFFDYAREAKVKSIKEIINEIKYAGIQILPIKPWLEVPEIRTFRGRADEIRTIQEKLAASRKLILYGINGIGKSWITTKVLLEENNELKSVCWIAVTKWMSIDRFLSLVAHHLYSNHFEAEANCYRSLEIANKLPQVIHTLKLIELTLVIDSVNSGNAEFIEFIKDLVSQIQQVELKGNLIISSTQKFFRYNQNDLNHGRLSEYHLNGFTLEDMKLVLSENKQLSNDDIDYIYHAVGGHPMSVHFLNNLLREQEFDINDIEEIRDKTVEEARDWIISKSIEQLSLVSKSQLLSLAIVEGMIAFDEAELLLDSNIKLKYLVRDLVDFNLVTFYHDGLTIHESIREVAISMLTPKARFSLHEELAKYHFAKMKHQKEAGDEVLYDTIVKWGANIEALSNSENLSEGYKMILCLDNELLDAIWAISRFGYPFDYETEDLSHSQKAIAALLERGLIKVSDNPGREYEGQKMLYDLDKLDYWQDCLVIYLCLSRGLSNHVGYIPIFKPNYAFQEQVAIICHWEHCIEYMPLPPLTQTAEIDHINFIKSQFDAGAYDDVTDERREFLRGIIDRGPDKTLPKEPNWEMEEKSCPMFGHCCPGGKEQADICRA
ncbi:MAG TPA: dsDNA nuclease domain-containing protein, partial [Cyclobacteriaceae bacterium]|nr:dsDNA nuclease domain-containing protein [Cyclobacteriaceae bacterium]